MTEMVLILLSAYKKSKTLHQKDMKINVFFKRGKWARKYKLIFPGEGFDKKNGKTDNPILLFTIFAEFCI